MRAHRRLIAATASASVLVVLLAACGSATTSPAAPSPAGETESVDAEALVDRWVAAWESGDAEGMADLFTEDGVYVDNAFGAVQSGREEVVAWVELTHSGFADVDAEVHNVIASDDGIAISWTFSAHMGGAPAGFAVPATTFMELEDGKITSNTDTYNLADVLKQSGLPADFTPGA